MVKKQKINESEVMKFGFLGGIAEAAYCFIVVLVMESLNQAMPQGPSGSYGFLIFLLIFVFSAGVSGILVFGYPAYLAIQKRYIESLMTAITSFVALAITGILVFMLISLV
ncbi:MAG: hypothetical protein PHW95_00510 [Patescibacteria group bacterium]|nr:hypothetical protein [Patescibacteria group bacterium]